MPWPKGPSNPRWVGGIVKTTQGYLIERCPSHPSAMPNGYVRQHRLVMEKVLGRYLSRHEHVHHLNGNKSDNRPENLQLMTPAEHLACHHAGAVRSASTRKKISEKAAARWAAVKAVVTCKECGVNFNQRGRGTTFCSRECANADRKRRGWHPAGTGAKISATKRQRRSE